jgi:ABC-2 type transport system permease protein
MLPPTWQTISLFNPVVYLVDAFRWAFFDVTEFNPMLDVAFLLGFLLVCIVIVGQIFRTGYRLQH